MTTRKQWLIGGGLFILALALRLWFTKQWYTLPYGADPFLDARSYDEWAQRIADGELFSGRAFYQAPLYPYCLGLIYAIFGHQLALISILQCLFGTMTCVLIYLTTKKIFGELAGYAAGILSALYRPFIFFCAPLLKETLTVFVFAIFVWLIIDLNKNASWKKSLGLGFVLGCIALLRANALILLLPLLGIFLYKPSRAGFGKAILLLLAMLSTIAPATWHNWHASRDFVGITYSGGFNLYIGHSITGTGINTYPPEVSTDPAQEELDVTRLAIADEHKILPPSEVSNFWRDKALQFILSHPGEEVALAINKIWAIFSNQEVPDNYDMNFIQFNFETMLSWWLASFGCILTLTCWGLPFLFWDTNATVVEKNNVPLVNPSTNSTELPKGSLPQRQVAAGFRLILFSFFYAISVFMFYVTDRYRLPLLTFLFPLAGWGLAQVLTKLRARNWRQIGLACLLSVVFLIPSFFTLPVTTQASQASNWGIVAGLQSDQKQDQQAIDSLLKGAALDPGSVGLQATVKVTESLERLGQKSAAETLLKNAVNLHPTEGLAPYNLGRFYIEHGDTASAKINFQKALEISPWLSLPHLGLALAFIREHQNQAAYDEVQKGLTLEPSSPQLLQLKQILTSLGNY